MMNHARKILLLTAVFGLVGCNDPTMEPLPAPAPVAPTQAEASVEPAPVSAVDAPPSAPPAASAQPTENNAFPEATANEKTLHTLNMFLIEYQANGGQIPATVEEMIAKRIIPKIPPAPQGKRFEVDQKKAMVSFADQ
jgi:hypothetical protein